MRRFCSFNFCLLSQSNTIASTFQHLKEAYMSNLSSKQCFFRSFMKNCVIHLIWEWHVQCGTINILDASYMYEAVDFITARQRCCGKVIFSAACVCQSVCPQRGSLWDHYLWCIGPHCTGPFPQLHPPNYETITHGALHLTVQGPFPSSIPQPWTPWDMRHGDPPALAPAPYLWHLVAITGDLTSNWDGLS